MIENATMNLTNSMKREPGAGRRPATLVPGVPRPPGPPGVGERGETLAGEGGKDQDRSRTLQTQGARRPLTGKPQEDPGSAQPDVINAWGDSIRFIKMFEDYRRLSKIIEDYRWFLVF